MARRKGSPTFEELAAQERRYPGSVSGIKQPIPDRPTSRYMLPDGRIVDIFDDVVRGAYFCSFTLENGRIVSAVRLPKPKKP